MTTPLEQIAGYGVVGALLVVALLALRALHQELAAERAARIQDAKDNTALLLKIQQATTDAIGKLYDLAKAREDR
ncbi:MAG: hypothetical protein C4308_15110 [Chitinophagaceae bacterium]